MRQRLVRTHPTRGSKSLYLSSHAGSIVGWPVPEARAFLRDLVEHATQRQFVYAHQWRVGDLVMWDNRQTMHRARPFPAHEPRDMRRTTLMGEGPTVRAGGLKGPSDCTPAERHGCAGARSVGGVGGYQLLPDEVYGGCGGYGGLQRVR